MGKRDTVKKNRSKQKKQDLWVILIISLFAVAIVGVIIWSQIPKVVTPTFAAKPQADGLNMGDPNAKVKVIEFADFQCPYCALYWKQVEPTIITTYISTNKVYYTYSPMAFLGQESVDSAEAVYCANDQGKFWEYRDMLFANHTGENVGDFTQTKLQLYAKNLGLDTSAFNSCLSTNKFQQKVTDDNTFASTKGVNSTPSFLVNDKVVNASELQSAIDAALAQ
jgi:protein-disulfide isomerase